MEIILERIPQNDAEFALREQSIGEARGLHRMAKLVDIEITELREKIKEQDIK